MSAYLPEGAWADPRAPWNDDDDPLDEFLPDPDEAYETARDEALHD